VKIDTLDNPGWAITIDLNETKAETKVLERIKIDRNDGDWIHYWVEKKTFHVRCGPVNLSEAIQVFVDWFES
jgi:hypothetical protein